jgi:hypothetical protein
LKIVNSEYFQALRILTLKLHYNLEYPVWKKNMLDDGRQTQTGILPNVVAMTVAYKNEIRI